MKWCCSDWLINCFEVNDVSAEQNDLLVLFYVRIDSQARDLLAGIDADDVMVPLPVADLRQVPAPLGRAEHVA